MGSFYDVLNEEAEQYYKVIGKESLTWSQLEAFLNHGSFLDALPVVNKIDVAKEIVKICAEYNRNDRATLQLKITDQDVAEIKAQKGQKYRAINIDHKRRRKSHLDAAINFRSKLTSIDEACKLSNDPELPGKIKEWGLAEEPYYQMVSLIDTFINDLKNETYEMVSKNSYTSLYPSKTPLKEYLMNVAKGYNIKNRKKLIDPLIKDFDPKK